MNVVGAKAKDLNEDWTGQLCEVGLSTQTIAIAMLR